MNGDPSVVFRAKGALMLRHGIDSHEAFALLARWSAETGNGVAHVADELVRRVSANPSAGGTEADEFDRWIEAQLRT